MFPYFSALQAIITFERLVATEETEENDFLIDRSVPVMLLHLASNFAIEVILMYSFMRLLPPFHFERHLMKSSSVRHRRGLPLLPLLFCLIFISNLVEELLYFSSFHYNVQKMKQSEVRDLCLFNTTEKINIAKH